MTISATASTKNQILADGDLITDALGGGETGFEELVRRYQRPIVSYIFRMLNDYDAALDVTQEVFIKVYNSLDKYSREYKFSTWLYRIAHNAAIDYMRRNAGFRRSLELENEDGVYELQLESRAPSPELEHERSEWKSEIDTVINCLPAVYRELILLRHSQDLSYDEIAAIKNLPLGTVKNRLFRAREMMREIFIERGIIGI